MESGYIHRGRQIQIRSAVLGIHGITAHIIIGIRSRTDCIGDILNQSLYALIHRDQILSLTGEEGTQRITEIRQGSSRRGFTDTSVLSLFIQFDSFRMQVGQFRELFIRSLQGIDQFPQTVHNILHGFQRVIHLFCACVQGHIAFIADQCYTLMRRCITLQVNGRVIIQTAVQYGRRNRHLGGGILILLIGFAGHGMMKAAHISVGRQGYKSVGNGISLFIFYNVAVFIFLYILPSGLQYHTGSYRNICRISAVQNPHRCPGRYVFLSFGE